MNKWGFLIGRGTRFLEVENSFREMRIVPRAIYNSSLHVDARFEEALLLDQALSCPTMESLNAIAVRFPEEPIFFVSHPDWVDIEHWPNPLLNYHASMLPAYRGGSPMNWVIINGEKSSGVTIHEMTEKLDGGPIVMQECFSIVGLGYHDLRELTDKTFGVLTRKLLRNFNNLWMSRTAQDEQKAVYFHKRRPSDSYLQLSKMSFEQVFRFVRALPPPLPPPFAKVDDLVVGIVAVRRPTVPIYGSAGCVVRGYEGGVAVVTPGGGCILDQILISGIKKPAGDILKSGMQFE